MKLIKLNLLVLLISISGIVEAQTTGNKPNLLSIKEFAAKLNESKNAQILDARSNEEFLQNHIKGAVNLDAKSPAYQQEINGLSKDRPTFVYSIANGRSSVLSAQLREKGFKQVYELPGGLTNWIGSGYPIISTTKKGVALSKAQYAELTGSAPLILIDFGSKYCGACKKLVPVLDSLKTKTGFAPKIISIEEYDNPALAHELKINVLPTLVLYQNKKEVWRRSGFSSTSQIEQVKKARLASTK